MSTLVQRGMNTEGNYIFLSYDPKAPISEKNLRTVKCMYKTASGKNNVCALLPPLVVESVKERLAEFMPYFMDFLESEQDKIVKSLHVSDDASFTSTQVSLSAILDALQAEKSSGRLNKDILASWFDSNMLESLTVLFADKLGISDAPTQEEEKKLENFIGVYKVKISGLAANSVHYHTEECDKLLNALEKCGIDSENDVIAGRIVEKLEKMKAPLDVSGLLDI